MRYKNILLTGATGFLGAHILENLVRTTNANVFCLVRSKSKKDAKQKFEETIKCYFESGSYDRERLTVIRGDFTKNNFGITKAEWRFLNERVDAVIHAGALVKHFGSEAEFEEVNVTGTKNVIDFCINNNLYMMYISTMAVAGRFSRTKCNKKFTEQDFMDEYVLPSNIYVRSKAKAEDVFVESVNKSLRGCIVRLGAITGRFSDGRFQKNGKDNAFYSRIQVALSLGLVPKQLSEGLFELSPVDYCSDAIVKILNNSTEPFEVYHLYNNNFINFKILMSNMKELGYSISDHERISYDKYKTLAKKRGLEKELFTGFCLYMRNQSKSENSFPIEISCEDTLERLKKLNFNWPVINVEYTKKIIESLDQEEGLL